MNQWYEILSCLQLRNFSEEKKRSIHGASVSLSSPGRPSACQFDINVETKVCVVRKNALRLCVMSNDEEENPTVHVYHSVQNSRYNQICFL